VDLHSSIFHVEYLFQDVRSADPAQLKRFTYVDNGGEIRYS
jgi:hypothetical protein